jgi:hypothetical protein
MGDSMKKLIIFEGLGNCLIALIIILFGSTSAIAANAGAGNKTISAVRKEITLQLKDPISARFRNVHLYGGTVCGEVNSKNIYGGYVGFKRFYGWKKFIDEKNKIYTVALEGEGEELDIKVFPKVWDRECAKWKRGVGV